MSEIEKLLNDHLTLSNEEFKPHLSTLFQMLRDESLPLTDHIAELMLSFPAEITSFLFDIFGNNEDSIVLKSSTLDFLVPKVPFFVKIALEDELQRIAKNPTDEEKSANLDKKAEEVLSGFI